MRKMRSGESRLDVSLPSRRLLFLFPPSKRISFVFVFFFFGILRWFSLYIIYTLSLAYYYEKRSRHCGLHFSRVHLHSRLILHLCMKKNAVIQPHCWYHNKQYNCGLSLACTIAGGKTKDLCNGGPLWQCCVPASADVQTPTFSLNDASKFSFHSFRTATNETMTNANLFLLSSSSTSSCKRN